MDTGADGEPVGRDQPGDPTVTDLRLAGELGSEAGKGWGSWSLCLNPVPSVGGKRGRGEVGGKSMGCGLRE